MGWTRGWGRVKEGGSESAILSSFKCDAGDAARLDGDVATCRGDEHRRADAKSRAYLVIVVKEEGVVGVAGLWTLRWRFKLGRIWICGDGTADDASSDESGRPDVLRWGLLELLLELLLVPSPVSSGLPSAVSALSSLIVQIDRAALFTRLFPTVNRFASCDDGPGSPKNIPISCARSLSSRLYLDERVCTASSRPIEKEKERGAKLHGVNRHPWTLTQLLLLTVSACVPPVPGGGYVTRSDLVPHCCLVLDLLIPPAGVQSSTPASSGISIASKVYYCYSEFFRLLLRAYCQVIIAATNPFFTRHSVRGYTHGNGAMSDVRSRTVHEPKMTEVRAKLRKYPCKAVCRENPQVQTEFGSELRVTESLFPQPIRTVLELQSRAPRIWISPTATPAIERKEYKAESFDLLARTALGASAAVFFRF
ncbi:uncharacterized protein FOMMEDRAFT_156562 [Fomitiporia mediterranea MF3/22]|uniref:uncharacterized protein n=1 Tax=Fomitiporia mediterranea (strain MF3/22) TaxID=694068 RepID=UPI0004407C71|nr:uncharacterized protein FOMMEDRAFT_156562 [Fomitiporia mediterranea MF3/22]EJD03180.1 hypothetical protein FOMMEDRAFT_156562 [Fomitiporia mediterranea MF3/22]